MGVISIQYLRSIQAFLVLIRFLLLSGCTNNLSIPDNDTNTEPEH